MYVEYSVILNCCLLTRFVTYFSWAFSLKKTTAWHASWGSSRHLASLGCTLQINTLCSFSYCNMLQFGLFCKIRVISHLVKDSCDHRVWCVTIFFHECNSLLRETACALLRVRFSLMQCSPFYGLRLLDERWTASQSDLAQLIKSIN